MTSASKLEAVASIKRAMDRYNERLGTGPNFLYMEENDPFIVCGESVIKKHYPDCELVILKKDCLTHTDFSLSLADRREKYEPNQKFPGIRKPDWAVDQIRRETGLIEDICECGVGHPNKDFMASCKKEDLRWIGVHGCCGCCSGRKRDLKLAKEQEHEQASDNDNKPGS